MPTKNAGVGFPIPTVRSDHWAAFGRGHLQLRTFPWPSSLIFFLAEFHLLLHVLGVGGSFHIFQQATVHRRIAVLESCCNTLQRWAFKSRADWCRGKAGTVRRSRAIHASAPEQSVEAEVRQHPSSRRPSRSYDNFWC